MNVFEETMTPLTYAMHDGVELLADLYWPAGEGPHMDPC